MAYIGVISLMKNGIIGNSHLPHLGFEKVPDEKLICNQIVAFRNATQLSCVYWTH